MQTYTVDIAGEPVTLPIVPINQKLAISLLMVIDMGVKFGERIGKAMAAKLAPAQARHRRRRGNAGHSGGDRGLARARP